MSIGNNNVPVSTVVHELPFYVALAKPSDVKQSQTEASQQRISEILTVMKVPSYLENGSIITAYSCCLPYRC